MSRREWAVARYRVTGGFGCKRGDEHLVEGGNLFVVPTYDEAFAKVRQLNGRAALAADEFERRTAHVPMRPLTKDALRAIMVDGMKWAEAARRFRITESGILRAMRRVDELNPETA
jgi:hypothetical protein